MGVSREDGGGGGKGGSGDGGKDEESVELWYICRLLKPPPRLMEAKGDEATPGDNEGVQDPDVPQHEAHVPQSPRDQAQGLAPDRHDLDQLHELPELQEEDEEEEEIVDDEKEEDAEEDDFASGVMGTDDSTDSGSLAMHLVTVEEMVHDIKRMLLHSTSEISKMQEADHQVLKRQGAGLEANQKDVTELADKLQTLQDDVQSMLSQLQTVVKTQAALGSRLDKLEKERTAVGSDTAAATATAATAANTQDAARGDQSEINKSAHPPKWKKSKQAAEGEGGGGLGVETEITAAACKSLSLSQALGEKVQELDVSVSSEEDEERAESRASDWDIERELSEKGNLKMDRSYPQFNRETDAGRRRQTVQELVESEQDYCRQLWGLLDGCLAPLQESRLVSSRDLRLMFPPYLSRLYRQHCQLLATLQERLLAWSWNGVVGDVFARMTDPHTDNLMALYRDYLNDLQAALTCFKQHVTTSRSFRAFIKTQREQGQGDMMSLLLAPLQRMPKYSLQLQQLLKYTPSDHPDHYYLQSSLAQLRTFVNLLNDEMAHTMHFVNVEEDNMRFGGKGQSFRSSASGSSCENSHLPSARDSGIHSNGEDFHGSRGLLHSASDKALSPDQMDRYGVRNRRGVMSARSQPDLSHNALYGGGGGYLMDGMHTVAHLPPHDRGNRYRRQRQRRREQVIDRLGRHGSPSPAYGAHLFPGYSSSPRMRPASAVDFLGSPETNFQGSRDRLFARPQTSLGAPSYDGRSRIPSGHHHQQHHPHHGHNGKYVITSNPVSSGSSFSNSPRETGQPVLIDGKVVYVEGLYDRLQPPDNSYVLHDEDETRGGTLLVGNLQDLQAMRGQYMGDPHEAETDNSGELSQEDEEDGIASSLAHSLRQEAAALDEEDGDMGNVSQGFEQGLGSVSVLSEGQENSPVQEHESDSNRPIFDKNELRLNLESLADTDRDPVPISSYGSSSLSNPSSISPDGAEVPPSKACELAVKSTTAASLLSVTKMPPPAPKRVAASAEDGQGYQAASAAPAATGPMKATPIQDTRSSGGSHQEDDSSGKRDKKKKRDSKTYSSSENLNRSSEDLSGTRKKPSIRTSLKNFFGKKKGSVRMEDLEAEFAKEQSRPKAAGPARDINGNTTTSPTPWTNPRSPLVFLFKDLEKHPSTAV